MKTILKLTFLLLPFSAKAQIADTAGLPEGPVKMSASIQTNHLWRGLIITDKPMVSAQVSFTLDKTRKFKAGIWGGASISNDTDGTHYKEINYYLQYAYNGLSIGVWDLFNSRNINRSLASDDIFNYHKDKTAHIIDLRTSYQLPPFFPLNIEADILLYGGAHAGEVVYKQVGAPHVYDKNRYSTYLQLSYPLVQHQTVNLEGYIGSAFALNGRHGTLYGRTDKDFDVVNIGVTASKNLTLLGHTIPVQATTLWNPANKYARVQVGAALF